MANRSTSTVDTTSTVMPIPARPRYWRVTAMFAVVISLVSLRYLSSNPEFYFGEQAEVYLANRAVLVTHVVGASVALVLGAIQMLPTIRATRPRVHRLAGRVYALGVVVGSIGGLVLARTAYGGSVSTIGFAALAILWLGTLLPAIGHIRRGDIAAHRRWMIRNYALTYAAVTLRLWLPVLAVMPGLGFVNAYRTVSWLCWVPNLIAAEFFLRRSWSTRTKQQVTPVAPA